MGNSWIVCCSNSASASLFCRLFTSCAKILTLGVDNYFCFNLYCYIAYSIFVENYILHYSTVISYLVLSQSKFLFRILKNPIFWQHIIKAQHIPFKFMSNVFDFLTLKHKSVWQPGTVYRFLSDINIKIIILSVDRVSSNSLFLSVDLWRLTTNGQKADHEHELHPHDNPTDGHQGHNYLNSMVPPIFIDKGSIKQS